jgi:hypothetical protein
VFQAKPDLAEDTMAGNRYNDASAAVLAGRRLGREDPPLDEAAKALWRLQAIDWLRTDQAACSKMRECGPPQGCQIATQTLQARE